MQKQIVSCDPIAGTWQWRKGNTNAFSAAPCIDQLVTPTVEDKTYVVLMPAAPSLCILRLFQVD